MNVDKEAFQVEDSRSPVTVTDEVEMWRMKAVKMREANVQMEKEMNVIKCRCDYYQKLLYVMTESSIDKGETIEALKRKLAKKEEAHKTELFWNQIGCFSFGFVVTAVILMVVLSKLYGWW